MNNLQYPYDESLLQWIWQHLEFATQSLKTACGRPVQIIHPGNLNNGAGPDFSDAVICIEGVECHGDAELHIFPGGWVQHNHEQSELFNRVILHIVYDYDSELNPGKVKRPDGTSPPLLVLKPYLQKSLQTLFEQRRKPSLPCGGNLTFINQAAFEEQIEKAHHDYFEYKVDFLLHRYPASLPVSEAWLYMFTAGLFHTLGIPVNRKPMEYLHTLLHEEPIVEEDIKRYINAVSGRAFSRQTAKIANWKHSGMRPASRPEMRVSQAAALLYSVKNLPFRNYLSRDLDAWNKVIKAVPPSSLPGRQMLTILKQTVYFPASFLLGDLLHSHSLKKNAYVAWRNIRGGVPGEVTAPFEHSGFEMNNRTRKPGLAHQLKRYCRAGNCHRCEVFKKAISS